MQIQLKLSGTGNNHLGLAITIMEHLNQSRTRKNNPQVKPEHTTTVQNRQKASNTSQNLQEPYKNCNNHGKVATPILTWQDSSTTGHNQLAGSKSKQNSNNQLTDQTRTYQNPPEQTRSIKHLTVPSRAISNLAQICKYSYIDPELARFIYNWPEPSCSI